MYLKVPRVPNNARHLNSCSTLTPKHSKSLLPPPTLKNKSYLKYSINRFFVI